MIEDQENRNDCSPSLGVACSWSADCGAATRLRTHFLSRYTDLPPAIASRESVAIWVGSNGAGNVGIPANTLTASDIADVMRLAHEDDRWAMSATRSVARVWLGRLLGCAPEEVAIFRDQFGKPVLDPASHGSAARRWHFSVSHTRGVAAVAVAQYPIGVDVEHIRAFPEMYRIARKLFSAAMSESIERSGSEAEAVCLFFRFWTLCEAISKSSGKGLPNLPENLCLTASHQPRLLDISEPWGPTDRWQLGHVKMPIAGGGPYGAAGLSREKSSRPVQPRQPPKAHD